MFKKSLVFAVVLLAGVARSDDISSYRIQNFEQMLQRHSITIPDHKYIESFQNWLERFFKDYEQEEVIISKFLTFCRNYDLVEKYNYEDALKKVTYELNAYADLSDREWQDYMMAPPEFPEAKLIQKPGSEAVEIPESVDWRNRNGTSHVTKVKYQGPCGSCWAFATTAVIESAISIYKGWTRDLSVQQLLDCTPNTGKCKGGEPVDALQYARDHGLVTAHEYPYTYWSRKCIDDMPISARISGWTSVESEEQLAQVVALQGPAIVCANFANNRNRFYRSGISDIPDCSTEPTHALTVVGYGPDYWLLKNSYSSTWGEKGYMRVKRGVNWCGINTEKPLLPIL